VRGNSCKYHFQYFTVIMMLNPPKRSQVFMGPKGLAASSICFPGWDLYSMNLFNKSCTNPFQDLPLEPGLHVVGFINLIVYQATSLAISLADICSQWKLPLACIRRITASKMTTFWLVSVVLLSLKFWYCVYDLLEYIKQIPVLV
jgi:hypothetical protein